MCNPSETFYVTLSDELWAWRGLCSRLSGAGIFWSIKAECSCIIGKMLLPKRIALGHNAAPAADSNTIAHGCRRRGNSGWGQFITADATLVIHHLVSPTDAPFMLFFVNIKDQCSQQGFRGIAKSAKRKHNRKALSPTTKTKWIIGAATLLKLLKEGEEKQKVINFNISKAFQHICCVLRRCSQTELQKRSNRRAVMATKKQTKRTHESFTVTDTVESQPCRWEYE